MSDFQQTVDLREKMEKRRKPAAPPLKAVTPIEKIYQAEDLDEPEEDLRKINQPKAGGAENGLIKPIVFLLAILVVGLTVYFLFFRQPDAAVKTKAQNWYAVKLVDGEIFYGQVFDVKADPVVIDNVYYNYDQVKPAAAAKDQTKTIEETGNIRLVKRGKETHGPDGSMNVVRAQVLFLEPLKADSKVLQAILEYEK